MLIDPLRNTRRWQPKVTTLQVLLCPMTPIQRTVLNRLSDVLGQDLCCPFQVCYRPSYFEDSIVRAGAEPLLLHGAFEQPFAVTGEFAVRANLAGAHLRV